MHTRFARLHMLAGLLLCASLCASCRCYGVAFRPVLPPPQMMLGTVPALNDSSALAVDVVLVYDEALLAPLQALTARAWFAQREQLRKDHPDPRKTFDIWTLELVPAQDTTLVLEGAYCARSGFVFADYLTPGDHRTQFVPRRPGRVVLGAEAVEAFAAGR